MSEGGDMQAVAGELVEDHLAHCAADATREGGQVRRFRVVSIMPPWTPSAFPGLLPASPQNATS